MSGPRKSIRDHDAYGIMAQAFHWIIAALVFVQLGIGVYAADLPVSLARLQWLSRHKEIGITILALMLLRLAWRLVNSAPPLPRSMPLRERRTATGVHALLYLLLIATPLAGWLHASAAGLSINWFGLFTVPDLVGKAHELSDLFKEIHEVLATVLSLLLALHIAGALRHAVKRDGVIGRMLPWNAARAPGGEE